MKLIPYVMATSFLLLAAPWAGAQAVQIIELQPDATDKLDNFIEVAGEPCKKACKACAKAFWEACGGQGDYHCGFDGEKDKCVCSFSCDVESAKYATDIELFV